MILALGVHVASQLNRKQVTKFTCAKLTKLLFPGKLFHNENSMTRGPDEAAFNEPPHQDLHCLQIQLSPFLASKALKLRPFFNSCHDKN